jgi:glycosyltransferase involved in cell wall biosynthesis
VSNQPARLAIIVPCFNEEEVLPDTSARLTGTLENLLATQKCTRGSQIFFVDDGSTDETWQVIERLIAGNPLVAGIKLSRNFGHQNALLAGLFTADADAAVTIDADLQDDIDAIETMLDRYLLGYDVVYGVRRRRDLDSMFKRQSARMFYRTMQALGTKTIVDHADYRLLSRQAILALREYREVNLFLRGIVPLLGYKSTIVQFDRHKRLAGQSKYPLRKMVEFAVDAVTSFSVVPLRLISAIGVLLFFLSMIFAAWATWIALGTEAAVPGWASTLLPILLLGGIQTLCLGVLGEYLGKIYVEVKSRPRYIIELVEGLRVSRPASAADVKHSD